MKTPVYSIFILHDNGTWQQPSFRITGKGCKKLTEHEIRMIAENHYGGFISYGLQEDPETAESYVTKIPTPP